MFIRGGTKHQDFTLTTFIPLFLSHLALCVYNEVHQSASTPAGCPHSQTTSTCSYLDGFFAGFFPRAAGRISSLKLMMSLSLFWVVPFLTVDTAPSQVLKGDIRPAIETHEMLYQVTKKHNFLPEVISLSLCLEVSHQISHRSQKREIVSFVHAAVKQVFMWCGFILSSSLCSNHIRRPSLSIPRPLLLILGSTGPNIPWGLSLQRAPIFFTR